MHAFVDLFLCWFIHIFVHILILFGPWKLELVFFKTLSKFLTLTIFLNDFYMRTFSSAYHSFNIYLLKLFLILTGHNLREAQIGNSFS